VSSSPGVEEEVGWRAGLRTLAVRRGHPLLAAAGLPPALAAAPRKAMEAARELLLAHERLPRSSINDAGFNEAVERLRRRFFERVASEYDPLTAEELRSWLKRYFVDKRGSITYSIWNTLLPGLAGAYGHPPSTPSPLPPDTAKRFDAVVRAHFSREASARREQDAELARATPLSELERKLVTLEFDPPEEPFEIDVVGHLAAAAGYEHTRQALSEISRLLDADERIKFLAWARREAALLNIPQDFHLPPTER
jgi:hypothetical protein